MSQSPKRTGQSGAAQVVCMARRALRWSAVARRLARPTSTTLPSPPNTMGMMSASQARRRTVAGGSGWPSNVSQTLVLVESVVQGGEVDQHEISAGRRAPGAVGAVTSCMKASALSWSNVRPSSGLACSAATAASKTAENLASASGSRLMRVWHMPSRSVHRDTDRCALQPFVVAQAVVAGEAPGEVADLAVEPSTDDRAAQLDELRSHRRQLGATGVVEAVGGAGDRVGVTRRTRPGCQRRMHLGHRRAHRGPLGDQLRFA